MLQLFPRYQKRILLYTGIWLAVLACMAILYGVSVSALILAAIVGILLVVGMQAIACTNYHNQLLSILYNQLDVDRFLRLYEPLLSVPVKNPQMHSMIRLHLSNAYCAQGRFDEAVSVLKSTKLDGKDPEQATLARFAVVSNLCYCAEQENDLPAAKAYLKELLDLKAQLEQMQKSKPEKKRMAFFTGLNEQCVQFLETGKADVEFLKSQVQSGNAQQLHRITTSLWIARAYLSQNNRREAEKLLTRIVELAPGLYVGRCAQELLDQLPAKAE